MNRDLAWGRFLLRSGPRVPSCYCGNEKRDAYDRYTVAMVTFLNCPPNPTSAETFERCCKEYEELFFASAFCWWSRGTLLNSSFRSLNSITAVLGPIESGEQDARIGFRELANAMVADGKKVHVHEFQQPQFHPKLYVFRRSDKSGALIIGSSNFTNRAFCKNEELDVLLEGKLEGSQFESLRQRFNDWMRSSRCLTGQCSSK
jgi:hypothetical protein